MWGLSGKQSSFNVREFTLEKNHMHVMDVKMLLDSYSDIWDFRAGRSSASIMDEEEPTIQVPDSDDVS